MEALQIADQIAAADAMVPVIGLSEKRLWPPTLDMIKFGLDTRNSRDE